MDPRRGKSLKRKGLSKFYSSKSQSFTSLELALATSFGESAKALAKQPCSMDLVPSEAHSGHDEVDFHDSTLPSSCLQSHHHHHHHYLRLSQTLASHHSHHTPSLRSSRHSHSHWESGAAAGRTSRGSGCARGTSPDLTTLSEDCREEAEVSSGSSSLFPTWLHRTTNQLCAALGSASLTLGDPNQVQGHGEQRGQSPCHRHHSNSNSGFAPSPHSCSCLHANKPGLVYEQEQNHSLQTKSGGPWEFSPERGPLSSLECQPTYRQQHSFSPSSSSGGACTPQGFPLCPTATSQVLFPAYPLNPAGTAMGPACENSFLCLPSLHCGGNAALQQQQADMEQGAWQAHTPHSWQHTLPSSPRSFTGLGRSNSSSLSQGEASWAQGQAGLLSRWQGVAPPGGPQP
ncbi:hypothetical protein V8C86DRAFT_2862905 [Haematococcus lacustris]